MKVLSVDFDYIMAPCIKLYNGHVGGDENPTVTWNNLERGLGIDNFLCYDADALIDIATIIAKNVKNGAYFFAINEHQEIIPLIDCDEKIDLVNIDFHHDVLYNPDTMQSIADLNEYTCANWVGYLQYHNKLEKYTWIKAPQSDMYNLPDIPIDIHIGGRKNISSLDTDFDVVVLCLSPQWVPYKYHHLYQMIISMATA